MDNSQPLEPDAVWTAEEWAKENPWTDMPKSPLRDELKTEAFRRAYSGGRAEFHLHGSMTGRFKAPPEWNFRVPEVGDRVHINIEKFLRDQT